MRLHDLFTFLRLFNINVVQSREREMGTNLLVLTIVPGHGAVGSLSLNGFAIGADEDGRHQSQRSKT